MLGDQPRRDNMFFSFRRKEPTPTCTVQLMRVRASLICPGRFVSLGQPGRYSCRKWLETMPRDFSMELTVRVHRFVLKF